MSATQYICPGCGTVVIQVNGKAHHLNLETDCQYNHDKLLAQRDLSATKEVA